MARDFDRQDESKGPLDIFIMALYRVDKVGGMMGYGQRFWFVKTVEHPVDVALVKWNSGARQQPVWQCHADTKVLNVGGEEKNGKGFRHLRKQLP